MDADNTQQIPDVPKHSEGFGMLRNVSETFGSVPHFPERNENHILTVRQVARMFEEAGVPRTERSITNWCHGDPMRPSRLDAGFDQNERKFFITPQSVERVIAEEKAKLQVETMQNVSEGFGNLPNVSEAPQHRDTGQVGEGRAEADDSDNNKKIKELEKQIFLLEVGKSAAEQALTQIKEFMQENRTDYKDHLNTLTRQLVDTSKQVGELETRLLQIEGPKHQSSRTPDTPAPHIREAEIVPDHSFSQTEQRPTSEEVSPH